MLLISCELFAAFCPYSKNIVFTLPPLFLAAEAHLEWQLPIRWRCFTFHHIRSHLRWFGVLKLLKFSETLDSFIPLVDRRGLIKSIGEQNPSRVWFTANIFLHTSLSNTWNCHVQSFFIKKKKNSLLSLSSWFDHKPWAQAKHRQKWTQHLWTSEFP